MGTSFPLVSRGGADSFLSADSRGQSGTSNNDSEKKHALPTTEARGRQPRRSQAGPGVGAAVGCVGAVEHVQQVVGSSSLRPPSLPLSSSPTPKPPRGAGQGASLPGPASPNPHPQASSRRRNYSAQGSGIGRAGSHMDQDSLGSTKRGSPGPSLQGVHKRLASGGAGHRERQAEHARCPRRRNPWQRRRAQEDSALSASSALKHDRGATEVRI